MKILTSPLNQALNLYSIFGYLLPGFFLTSLFVIDYDFSAITRYYSHHGNLTLEALRNELDLKVYYIFSFFSTGTISDFRFIPFLIFLFFCYLLGHIVSAISSFVIERRIVKGLMGYPSIILMSGKEVKNKFFFGEYRTSYGPELIQHLKKLIDKTFEYNVDTRDYYWLCYSYIITKNPYLAPRVHHFVNLYGFSRNICATFIIYLTVRPILFNLLLGSTMDRFSWLTWALFLACCGFMAWNYLKLFRRQAIDIYFLFISVVTGNSKEIIIEEE